MGGGSTTSWIKKIDHPPWTILNLAIGWRKDHEGFFQPKAEKNPFWGTIDLKTTVFDHFMPEIVNFSCFLSFYPIRVPKRDTFFTVKQLRSKVHDPFIRRCHLVSNSPKLEKIRPHPIRIYKLPPTPPCKNQISPRMLTHLCREFKKWSDFHETSYTLPKGRGKNIYEIFLLYLV